MILVYKPVGINSWLEHIYTELTHYISICGYLYMAIVLSFAINNLFS